MNTTQISKSKSNFLSSIGSALKSAIIEEAPETAQEASAPAPVSWAGKPVSVNPGPVLSGSTAGSWGHQSFEADPEIRKVLEADIQEAAKPAYSEFAIAAESLASIIPDERQRFQAALATLAPRKLTLQQILTDVDECMATLDAKEKENQLASSKAREQKVGTRVARVAELGTKIDQLHSQITALELDRDRINAEISTETANIDAIDQRFKATCAVYRQELMDRKTKISNLVGR